MGRLRFLGFGVPLRVPFSGVPLMSSPLFGFLDEWLLSGLLEQGFLLGVL